MKLIILDRDGVINQDSDEFIKNETEWQAIPGSLEAIGRLTQNGYHIIVISNQSGLARGKLTIRDLNRIHAKMHTHVAQYGGAIDAVFFCPHSPEEGCDCRKPATGLFQEAQRRLRLSLRDVIVVGDRASDIEAAIKIQAKPMLVRSGKGQDQIDQGLIDKDIPVYDDLAAVVDHILAPA